MIEHGTLLESIWNQHQSQYTINLYIAPYTYIATIHATHTDVDLDIDIDLALASLNERLLISYFGYILRNAE